MYPVALRDDIRTWVLIQGKSQRAAARHFGLSRNTVANMLEEDYDADIEYESLREARMIEACYDAALMEPSPASEETMQQYFATAPEPVPQAEPSIAELLGETCMF